MIEFSRKGTGACPICKKGKNCQIQAAMQTVLEDIIEKYNEKMEIVIYVCPAFEEN